MKVGSFPSIRWSWNDQQLYLTENGSFGHLSKRKGPDQRKF